MVLEKGGDQLDR